MELTAQGFSSCMSATLAANPLPQTASRLEVLVALKERLKLAVQSMLAQFGPAAKEQIVALALAWFDAWDVPYIAGVIETTFKSFFRPFLEDSLKRLLGLEG